MTPEFKQKWIEALRSGQYTQATQRLKNEDGGFCCLGVACHLIDPAKWSPNKDVGGLDWGDCKSQLADQNLADKLGLPTSLVQRLAIKNDEGTTFAEIADYLEQHA
jgi:hypothetical protein